MRADRHGIVGVINDEARRGMRRALHVLFFHVVNFQLVRVAGGGVIACECRGDLKYGIGQLFSFRTDDHMGAGSLLGMEPPVVSRGQLEG